MNLDVLKQQILSCRDCGAIDEQIVNQGRSNERVKQVERVKIPSGQTSLIQSSSRPVPPSGEGTRYLFIGEAPGVNEDEIGEGFVGKSGGYLKGRLIPRVMKLKLKDCAFTNIIKCHPLDNRDPYISEIRQCDKWIQQEIAQIQPELIFTVGRISLQALLPEMTLKETHGQVLSYINIPLIPLYHPAAMDRAMPRRVLERDYQKVPQLLQEIKDNKQMERGEQNLILTSDELRVFLDDLKVKIYEDSSDLVQYKWGFDIETYEQEFTRTRKKKGKNAEGGNVDPLTNECIGMSFYEPDIKRASYIPMWDYELADDSGVGFMLSPLFFGFSTWNEVREYICEKLQYCFDNSKPFIHNAKFEAMSLDKYGLKIRKPFDTMHSAFVCREETNGLKAIVQRNLKYKMTELTSLIDLNKFSAAEIPLMTMFPYACDDAEMCYKWGIISEERMTEINGWEQFHLMQDLLPWAIEEEIKGIDIDEDKRREIEPIFNDQLESIDETIFDIYGEEINLNSTQQKSKMLAELLDTPEIRAQGVNFKEGDSTNAKDVLAKIAFAHEVIPLLIARGSWRTNKSTFVDGLPARLHPETNKLHPSINQVRTETTRLSYNSPDMQNIPVRTKISKRLREVFIPDELGQVLWAIDQSQIEIRYAAHWSQDTYMLELIRAGISLHIGTCERIYGITVSSSLWEASYKRAKNGNFCVLFDGGINRLAETLECSRDDAKSFHEEHRKVFPEFHQWIINQAKHVRRLGYAETISGFRRYIPELRSENRALASRGRRVAINVPIQGSAANHIQKAMVAIYEWFKEEQLNSRMAFQVHDELVGWSHLDELEMVIEGVAQRLEHAIEISVPTPVDIEVGYNWGEISKWEDVREEILSSA